MTVLHFEDYFKKRARAAKRASELVHFLNEQCEDNGGIPSGTNLANLEKEIVKVFFETETAYDRFMKNS